MEITKERLNQIIKEEMATILKEGDLADRKWLDNPANPNSPHHNYDADYDAGYEHVEAAHRDGKLVTPKDIPGNASDGWRDGFMDAYKAIAHGDLGI